MPQFLLLHFVDGPFDEGGELAVSKGGLACGRSGCGKQPRHYPH